MTKIDTSPEAIAMVMEFNLSLDALTGAVVGGWHASESSHKVVDPDLAIAIADKVSACTAAARDLVPALAKERDELRAVTEQMAEALRFYADRKNHAERFERCGDGCCSWPIGSAMHHDNDGDVARPALAAWGTAKGGAK